MPNNPLVRRYGDGVKFDFCAAVSSVTGALLDPGDLRDDGVSGSTECWRLSLRYC